MDKSIYNLAPLDPNLEVDSPERRVSSSQLRFDPGETAPETPLYVDDADSPEICKIDQDRIQTGVICAGRSRGFLFTVRGELWL